VRCARQAATVPNLRLEIKESCLKNLRIRSKIQ